jgi:hypothetical protein
VVRYDGEEMDVRYLRDDVRRRRVKSEVEQMLRRLRPESTNEEERSFPFGDLYVTVRRFEEAIIMHFPTGPDRGTVVSLEPEAGRDLNRFTSECLKRLRA